MRNFRSDDTAQVEDRKKRVWCHTVNLKDEGKNSIKEHSLPIASVGVAKNCFSLMDGESEEIFDIEKELGEYELRTSKVFNDFIRDNDFSSLLNVAEKGSSIEVVVNFMVIQMVLNLHNPQHKFEGNANFFATLTKNLEDDFPNVKSKINSMPAWVLDLYGRDFSEKFVRAANSTSSKKQICKVLFVLFMLAEAKGLPVLEKFLGFIRNGLFSGIYVEAIYHTGYEFDSVEPRPVFVIGPNVFSESVGRGFIFLPISHNFAFGFSVKKEKNYNSELNIYSANPDVLKVKGCGINIFKVSHDYIDEIVGQVLAGTVASSNTIYTPHELADVNKYLALQRGNPDFFYSPKNPERIN